MRYNKRSNHTQHIGSPSPENMRALAAALPLPSNLCKQRTVGVVPQTFCPTRQVEMVGILSIVDARLALSAHWTHCHPAAWQCPQRRLKGGMGRTSSHVAVRAKSSLGILPRGLSDHHFYCRGCCCIYNKVIVSSLTLMPRPLSLSLYTSCSAALPYIS